MDIQVLIQRLFEAGKWLVRLEPEAVRVEDQCVAGDPRRFLVSLAESAVDDIEQAVREDRRLSLPDVHRRMPVYDVAPVGIQPELVKDHLRRALLLMESIVVVARLFPGGFVPDIGPLEGLDRFAEHGRIRAAPQIPHEVDAHRIERAPCPPGDEVDLVHERFALQRSSQDRHSLEVPVFIQRDAPVVEEVLIDAFIGGAVRIEKIDVLAEPYGVPERMHKVAHDLRFLLAQFIGILPVHSRKIVCL